MKTSTTRYYWIDDEIAASIDETRCGLISIHTHTELTEEQCEQIADDVMPIIEEFDIMTRNHIEAIIYFTSNTGNDTDMNEYSIRVRAI